MRVFFLCFYASFNDKFNILLLRYLDFWSKESDRAAIAVTPIAPFR